MSEGKTITLKKDTLWKGIAILFAVLFLITIFWGWPGFSNNDNNNNNGNKDSDIGPQEVQIQLEANDPIYGDANAEISLVEFSDFQCPFCEKAYTGFISSLKNSAYVTDGDVNIIFKHFPLNSIHQYAQKAAEAAECANRQDKFWEYHDILFTHQQALDVASLKIYASQIGLNTVEFDSCLDNEEAKAEVIKESNQATVAGGTGTPHSVIVKNGIGVGYISGACPYSVFKQAIDATIAGNEWYQIPRTCNIVVE